MVMMVYPCKCSPLRRLTVLCVVLYGMGKLQTTLAGSDSCDVTTYTVQVVNGCPDSEEKWNKAAERKNCSAYASQCGEPNKLVYHCVINEYVNQTLEVCAYVQNIVLGKCTSYSISGNLIQQNSRTNCADFTNPCPVLYRSDQAYKYPGCYQLVLKLTTGNPSSTNNQDDINVSTSSTPNASFYATLNTHGQEGMATVIIIIPVSVLILTLVCVIYLFRNYYRRKPSVLHEHTDGVMIPLQRRTIVEEN